MWLCTLIEPKQIIPGGPQLEKIIDNCPWEADKGTDRKNVPIHEPRAQSRVTASQSSSHVWHLCSDYVLAIHRTLVCCPPSSGWRTSTWPHQRGRNGPLRGWKAIRWSKLDECQHTFWTSARQLPGWPLPGCCRSNNYPGVWLQGGIGEYLECRTYPFWIHQGQ